MKITQLFREQLGLSQEIMALFLGLSRSQIAMYEKDQRELPAATFIKLAAVSEFLKPNNETDFQNLELNEQQEKQLKSFLEKQIKELEFQELKTQRQLEAMQKKYNQNLVLHQWALHLQEQKSSIATVLLHQANRGIEKNGWIPQTNLLIKLEAIKSKKDYVNGQFLEA